MKNPLELHRALLRSGLEYVAIGNYFNAGYNVNCAMSILTQKPDSVIQLLGLTRDREYNNLVTYKKDFTESTKLSIMIYDTGKGLYPSRFETELIKRSVVDNDICRIPDFENQFWLFLYRYVFHLGMFPVEYRRMIIPKLEQRVGVSRPKFKHVGYYPKPDNISDTWKLVDKEFKDGNVNCGW